MYSFNPVRDSVFLFGKVCLVLALVFSWLTAGLIGKTSDHQSLSLNDAAPELIKKNSEPIDKYMIIQARNIFGYSDKALTTPTDTTPAPTSLTLRLVGTNLGNSTFAILENTKTKEQDVFDLNQTAFDQAKLIDVRKESVLVEHAGKEVLLELEEDKSPTTPSDSVETNDDESEFVVEEAELNKELSNLPLLLSQARAVPYFRDGQSIGMRLFAIKRGSLYEKLGLKNGDILLSINDNSLADPTQALKLFEQLKTEKEIKVALERAGQKKDVNYAIK